MSFDIPETKETVKAKQRPVVIITSNAEKELPDAFLRRCIFHYIAFPDASLMEQIVKVHHPDLKSDLLNRAMDTFYRIRSMSGLQKKPSTSELLDWLQALSIGGINPKKIEKDLPFLGVLMKKDADFKAVMDRLHSQERERKPSSQLLRHW